MPLGPLKPPGGSYRVWQIARGIAMWTILFAALLLFNGVQLLSLLLFPLSRRAFRRINRWAADTWWGWCVTVARDLNGTRILVSGDPLPGEEDAIVVANHQQMPDITALMDLARRQGRLGDLKFFVKDVLKWVPGIGWGLLFLGSPFLKRDWARDRSSIDRTFHAIVAEELPFWMVIFAEGTRITPAKLASSQARAERGQDSPMRHVLLPRPKGFAAAVSGLRTRAAAVYDVTIGYVDGVPTLGQYITGAVSTVHLHVRRFAIEGLPEAGDALAGWLRSRWSEKDALLERFYTEGAFPDSPVGAVGTPAR